MKPCKQSVLIAAGILMLAVSSLPGPASAEGTPQQRSACMGDAFRYCSEDIPNVAKIEACLLQNRERLHPACQAEFGDSGASQTQPAHFR